MEKNYDLDKESARNQLKAQMIFRNIARVWHWFFIVNIALFIIKFAIENPNQKFSLFFSIKLLLYFILWYSEQSNLLRCFLIFSECFLSSIYLANYLDTSMHKIRDLFSSYADDFSKVNQKKLNKTIIEVLNDYKLLIKKQKLINNHCEQTFHTYFMYFLFTIIYPIIVIFLPPEEIMLISVNSFNYLLTLTCMVLPPIYFNSTYLIKKVG